MENITLCWNNRVDAATLSAGSWQAGYGRDKLQESNIHDYAQTSSSTMASTRLRYDLGANYVVRAMAFMFHNMQPTDRWRMRFGLAEYDLDFTTGVKDERLTYGGGANGTTIDSSGNIVAASGGRIYHDPALLDNGVLFSEDISQSGYWGVVSGTVLDSQTCVLDAGGYVVEGGPALMPSSYYTMSVEARCIGGDGRLKTHLSDGVAAATDGATVTLTDEWQLMPVSLSTSSTAGITPGNSFYYVQKPAGTGQGTFQVRRWMLNAGATYLQDANGNRSYRKTTTTHLFRCLGLLREPARTQLLAATDAIVAGAVWSKGSQLTANGVSGTLLGVPAYSFTSTGVDSYVVQSKTIAASTTYTASYLTDFDGTGNNRLSIHDGGGGSSSTAFFVFRLVAPGVYLASVTFTTSAAQTAVAFYIGPLNTANGTTFRIAAPQLEAGDSRTSYIPNAGGAGTTVTRNADSATATVAAVTAGTLFEEAQALEGSSTHGGLHSYTGVRDAALTSFAALRSVHTGVANANVVDSLVINGGGLSFVSSSAVAAPRTTFRNAMSFKVNDFRSYADGVPLTPGVSGTVDSDMTVLDLTLSTHHSDVLARVVLWLTPLTNDQLDAITTSGPGAIGFDSGWMNALSYSPRDELPSDWGVRGHDLMAVPDEPVLGRYGTVEFDMTANYSVDYQQIMLGRFGVFSRHFQPEMNASYGGYQDALEDLSAYTTTAWGKVYGEERYKVKRTTYKLNWVSDEEKARFKQMQDAVGGLQEVLFLPDPSDAGKNQRDGGICLMGPLGPLDHMNWDVHSVGVVLKQKR
jgi:hypothetical protein